MRRRRQIARFSRRARALDPQVIFHKSTWLRGTIESNTASELREALRSAEDLQLSDAELEQLVAEASAGGEAAAAGASRAAKISSQHAT